MTEVPAIANCIRSHQMCSLKKGILKNVAKFQSLAQVCFPVLSCEFCEFFFNNIFFTENIRTTTFEIYIICIIY